MAFAFLFAGVLMVVAAVRGTYRDLATLIRNDFTGPGNFFLWAVAVMGVGAVGYIPAFRKISAAFLAAILLGLFLAKASPKGTGGGFFAQLQAALNRTTTGTGLHSPTAAAVPGSTSAAADGLPPLPTLTDLLQTLGIAN